MNRRAKAYLAGLGAFAMILVAISAFSWWFLGGSTMRPRILRSRLTLVVETPEGERSGSSVTQVTTYFPGGLTKAQGYAIVDRLVGEAAVVDLGARGVLFATFESQWALKNGGGSSGYNAALDPFPQEKFRGKYPNDASTLEKYAAYIDEVNQLKPKGTLPFKDLPVLVRFRDPSDPTSVELVDPSDLAASFGPGVTLKSAFVEITDDPITHRIEARLPWLKSSSEAATLLPLAYLRTLKTLSPAQRLRFTDFRRLPR